MKMSEKVLVVMVDGREFVLAAEPYERFWTDGLMKISGPVTDIAEVWTSADLNRFLRGTKQLPMPEHQKDIKWLYTADLPFDKCARLFQKVGSPKTPITPPRSDAPVEEKKPFDYGGDFCALLPVGDESSVSRGYGFGDPNSDPYKRLAEHIKATNDANVGEREPRKIVTLTLRLDGERYEGLSAPKDVAERLLKYAERHAHWQERLRRRVPRWDEIDLNDPSPGRPPPWAK
jgi:hypothetical protein